MVGWVMNEPALFRSTVGERGESARGPTKDSL